LVGLQDVGNASADRLKILWLAFGVPPDPKAPHRYFDVIKVAF
jgi:hypothetical protein